jgi:hypothetical protein
MKKRGLRMRLVVPYDPNFAQILTLLRKKRMMKKKTTKMKRNSMTLRATISLRMRTRTMKMVNKARMVRSVVKRKRDQKGKMKKRVKKWVKMRAKKRMEKNR